MTDSDKIHDEVSSFYAKAVAGAANPGVCCAGPPSDGIASLAGYDADAPPWSSNLHATWERISGR